MDHLLQKYDVLLFDSPPALAVTDPVVLGRNVGGVIVVVDAGATREPALVHVLTEMEKVNANVVGVVLNRYRRGRSSGYYYYYYDRYYSHEDSSSSDGDGGSGHTKHRRVHKGWLGRQLARLSR
jgi:Mrp family chromosome partitioning ATPase